MFPNSVLFFAAGFGTRMAPLTDTRPKPMVQVAGKPLLFHALDPAPDMKRVVNVHYLADQIIAAVPNDVSISDETDAILETGGGLKRALPMLGSSPVFTMNTDAVWNGPNPFGALRSAWRDNMDGLLLLVPKVNAHGHNGAGDFVMNDQGQITRGPGAIYTGCQIIRTELLHDIDKTAFSMWDLWNLMLERGTLFGTHYTGEWCDVGRPQSIEIAERMLTNV